MASSYCCSSSSVTFFGSSSQANKPLTSSSSSLISQSLPFRKTNPFLHSSDYYSLSLFRRRKAPIPATKVPNCFVIASSAKRREPLKIMIAGAPASGKGTQCEIIKEKYDLVHIAAGDLLRAEIAAGSENGKRAKEYMEIGKLVPNEIVVMIVRDRLMQPDAQDKGWLLDGYPRSLSQATALKGYGFHPDLFILLEVPEEILVERVVGRRLDPITGKIYHLKYSPPETEEIAARLTQRFDDTEEKVKLRLRTHHQNVESVLSMYEDFIIKVDGSVPKEAVYEQIDSALTKLLEQREEKLGSAIA